MKIEDLPLHHRAQAGRYRTAGWWRSEPVEDRLAEIARQRPDSIALVDRSGPLTYADFDELVTRAACGFWRMGLRPDDVVAIQLPNWREFAIYQQAAVRTGVTYLPLIPQLRAHDLIYLLGTAGARLLVIPSIYRGFDHRTMLADIRQNVRSILNVIVVGDEATDTIASEAFLAQSVTQAESEAVRGVEIDPDALRLISFTSGTESKPKGVCHSHNTALYSLVNHTRLFGLTHNDVIFTPSPVGHATGAIFGVEFGIVFGGKTVLMERWNAEEAVRLIAENGCTAMWGATTFYIDLMNAANLADHDISSFRYLFTAGAPVPRHLLKQVEERTKGRLVTAYGQSEGQNITISRPDDPEDKILNTDGTFQEGVEYRLVSADGVAVPVGEEGEIEYRSPCVCMGFLDAEHTARAFREDGFIVSGDLGIVDEDGYLRIVGRRKEIIIRGGENISPAEIEDILYRHPKVEEISIVGLPHDRLGQIACAVVVPRKGETVTLQDLTAFMAECGIAKFKFPERVEIVKQFPRSLTGKVQKDVLRGRILQRNGR
jgi:non-ribosomal peptide synthetase component E (peptide arylation enzyme)